MVLEKLRLYQFRCYEEVSLETHPKFNVFIGLNGQGKTSILEAIGLLAFFKSFRQARNEEILRVGALEGLISGILQHEGLGFDLDVKIWPKRKQAFFNKKSCRYLSEYVGKLSAVSFSPQDLEIIRGEPENRRVWVDRLSQIFYPQHSDIVSRYKKVLDHRNKLLRAFSEGRISNLPSDFETWTQELAKIGAELIHNRIHSVDRSVDKIARYYEEISHQESQVRIRYLSGQISSFFIEQLEQDLRNRLCESLSKEVILGTTIVGPHRDDLEVSMQGRLLKTFGSQGEVRSLVLALRLAEIDAFKSVHGVDPILLIDDFSSELDAERRRFLLDYLKESQSQVFLSTTEDLDSYFVDSLKGSTFVVEDRKVVLRNGNRSQQNFFESSHRNSPQTSTINGEITDGRG